MRGKVYNGAQDKISCLWNKYNTQYTPCLNTNKHHQQDKHLWTGATRSIGLIQLFIFEIVLEY